MLKTWKVHRKWARMDIIRAEKMLTLTDENVLFQINGETVVVFAAHEWKKIELVDASSPEEDELP